MAADGLDRSGAASVPHKLPVLNHRFPTPWYLEMEIGLDEAMTGDLRWD